MLWEKSIDQVVVGAGCRSGETPRRWLERGEGGDRGDTTRVSGGRTFQAKSLRVSPQSFPPYSVPLCWPWRRFTMHTTSRPGFHTIPHISLNSQQMANCSLWTSPMGIRCKSLLSCVYFQGPLCAIFLPSKRLDLYYTKHHMDISFLLCTGQLKLANVFFLFFKKTWLLIR